VSFRRLYRPAGIFLWVLDSRTDFEGQMKKYLFLSLAIILFFWPFLSLFGPARLRDYIYRTYTYAVIADQAIGDAADTQLAAERVLDFIHCSVFVPFSAPPVDATPLNDLASGIARCDQQGNIFAQLLSFKGIEASFIDLRGNSRYRTHSVARVLINGRWGIVDIMHGVILKDSSGAIAEFKDIQNKNPAFRSSRKGDFNSEWFVGFYNNLFAPDYPPNYWAPPIIKVSGTRKVLRNLVVFYHDLLGKVYFSLFQDAYLLAVRNLAHEAFDLTRPDERLYYRARNYQLCARFARAREAYQELARKFPESQYAERAAVFNMSVLMKEGEWKAARDGLKDFLKSNKAHNRISVAENFLEWCNYHLEGGALPEEASDVVPEAFYFR